MWKSISDCICRDESDQNHENKNLLVQTIYFDYYYDEEKY